jgi:hypothetical protein
VKPIMLSSRAGGVNDVRTLAMGPFPIAVPVSVDKCGVQELFGAEPKDWIEAAEHNRLFDAGHPNFHE